MLPVRIECRHYRALAPCIWHKRDGRGCAGCGDCEPIESRLLIVKLGAVGDVLRTTSLLPALHRRWPRAHVTWITGAASRPVLEGHPLIDRLLTPEASLPPLLIERFEAVYGLEADPPSAALATLSRADERFGFACDERGRVRPARDSATLWWLMGLDDRRKRENRRTYQALMLDLCELPGPPERPVFVVPERSRQRATAFHRAGKLGAFAGVIGLNTGGGRRWAQKKWTAAACAGFLALCRRKYPEIAIVLLGGSEEVSLNAALMARAPEGVFDGGCDNSFADFAALVESLSLLVTPDSLGLHAAQAVGTPAVALAGPTSPWELETYGTGAVLHAHDVPCIGCYRAECDKPRTCMERLSPEQVLAAAARWLGEATRRSTHRHRAAGPAGAHSGAPVTQSADVT